MRSYLSGVPCAALLSQVRGCQTVSVLALPALCRVVPTYEAGCYGVKCSHWEDSLPPSWGKCGLTQFFTAVLGWIYIFFSVLRRWFSGLPKSGFSSPSTGQSLCLPWCSAILAFHKAFGVILLCSGWFELILEGMEQHLLLIALKQK